MICGGCGNQEAYRWRAHEDGSEECDECGGLGAMSIPDVYYPGPYYDPNLAHPNRPWEAEKGPLVTSKEHKLALMREQGLYEKGDSVHGSRNSDKGLIELAKRAGFGMRPAR